MQAPAEPSLTSLGEPGNTEKEEKKEGLPEREAFPAFEVSWSAGLAQLAAELLGGGCPSRLQVHIPRIPMKDYELSRPPSRGSVKRSMGEVVKKLRGEGLVVFIKKSVVDRILDSLWVKQFGGSQCF